MAPGLVNSIRNVRVDSALDPHPCNSSNDDYAAHSLRLVNGDRIEKVGTHDGWFQSNQLIVCFVSTSYLFLAPPGRKSRGRGHERILLWRKLRRSRCWEFRRFGGRKPPGPETTNDSPCQVFSRAAHV